MKTAQIKQQIETAIKKDKKTKEFKAQVKTYLKQIANNVNKQQVNEVVNFVYEYLKHVPVMIPTIMAEAKKHGIHKDIKPMMKIVEEYFVNPYDLIPDDQGILGILDDAYFVMYFIQSTSDLYKKNTGVPLISLDFTQANQIIRNLLGQEIASVIELAVSGGIGANTFSNPLNQLMNYYNSTMYINDPVWGTASIDDVVTARLGAMGVV